MTYVPPNPRLVHTKASTTASKAQNTAQQLATLLPTTTTILSPVEVYKPGTTDQFSQGGIVGPGGSAPAVGVWTAPDVNGDGSAYQVLVEAFGGGGGGGGGSASTGGGGGGGGEYALEQAYFVEPGQSYVWITGQGGSPGAANSNVSPPLTVGMGTSGSVTMFDVAGLSPTGNGNGVQAEGGTGGDLGAVGIAGTGGTGSSNTLNYDGGPGGTNSSGNASDNPIAFVAINNATYWTPHPAPSNAISRWLVMNDASGSSTINDQSFNDLSASVTVYQPGGFTLAGPTAAPAQAPAFLGGAGTYGPNATIENGVAQFALVSLNQASARITNTSFAWGNAHQTFSGWIQCDPTGTWGNTAAGSIATISSNSQNIDTAALKGFAVYLFNAGTAASPNWEIIYAQGNGSSRYSIGSPLAPTPGTWYYVVATYNSGTMTLYVNGSSVGTTTTNATFTTPPGGSFNMTLGTNPGNTGQYFFGYMSNFWWAEGATAGTGLISAADGVTPATGGAGGGSAADAGGIGGEGIPAVTTTGGAGGIPLAIPTSLTALSLSSFSGTAGAAAGASNYGASVAVGAGGGGAGNKAAPPQVLTATYNLPTAASYCGTDATGGNATVLYSPAQQGTTTQLFQGGQGSDPSSGTKNAVILLPPGLAKLFPSATYTILACTLTVNNAIPGAAQPVILEIGASSDTSLASTWDGTHSLGTMGYLLVPAGAGAVTYDLLPTGFPALMQAGTAGAITLGPAATTTFESYAGTTAGSFYGSVYGPGSYDTSNNYLGPVLSVTYVLTSSVPNRGSWGGPGLLRVALVDNAHTPVSAVQAFATTDGNGNKFAPGYTGDTNSFDPTVTAPGQFVPETWKLVGGAGNPPFLNSWANQGGTFASLQFKRTSGMETRIVGVINGTSATNGWVFTLPGAYCPHMDFEAPLSLRGAPNASGTYLRVTASTGEVQIVNFQSIGYGVDVSIPLDVTS